MQPYDLWERDGSLRDVYVLDATSKDWASLLSLATRYGYRYSYDGQERPLPAVEDIFADRDGAHLLSIKVGRAMANCHFFIPKEIELDLDPREIKEDADHYEVLQFLEALAMGTKKRVLLTAENAQDIPFLCYDPSSQEWTVYEPPFQSQ